MKNSSPILRGDIWLFNPGQSVGHEQANTRPGLIISRDDFHTNHTALVVLVPVTTKRKNICSHIELKRVKGLEKNSYAMSEQIRCISQQRLIRRMARVDSTDLQTIEHWIQIILSL